MPIVVKDFIWKQTNDKIIIQVPLHGMHPSKADIFTSSQYVKESKMCILAGNNLQALLNEAWEHLFGITRLKRYQKKRFSQFLIAKVIIIVLLHPVDVSQIICTKTPTEILFDLKKCSEATWDSLEVIDLSKQEKQKFKIRLIQEEHERLQKQAEAKVAKKAQLKRVAVNEQIELDTKVRSRIEDIKKIEETRALGDLNEWKIEIEAPKKHRLKMVDLGQNLETPEGAKITELEENCENDSLSRFIKEEEAIRKNAVKSSNKEKLNKSNKHVPQLRSTRSLQILFTPREFPTPCRESLLEEESEFLRKQAEARRSAGFVNEDLRPEEKNPQFLLAKGREFLKQKNYLGAISAFSFGIKLNPKFLDLYMARSEAHLAVGNFKRTVDDCTSALDLLKPRLPINLNDRALCIGRRGVALYKLGFMRQGISELEASLKLKKNEEFEGIVKEYKLEFDEEKEKQEKQNEKREHGKVNSND